MKALSNTRGTSSLSDRDAAASLPAEDGLSQLHAEFTNSAPSVSIPWTISNKYYTADVHFELRTLEGFAGYLASEVPAIVYVWNHGETYRTAVPELAKRLEHYHPEVSLAVRFSPGDRLSETDVDALHREGDEHGDDQILDEFISSHRFEYIDGDRGRRQPTQDGSSYSDDEDGGASRVVDVLILAHDPMTGVPGLPRVVDALSTIMWPTLVQSSRTTQRKTRAGNLLDWAAIEDAGGGSAPLLEGLTASQGELNQRMQKEIDALENWLEEDTPSPEVDAKGYKRRDHNDPWSTSVYHGEQYGFDYDGGSTSGFEDDFDEFVGAPVDVTYGAERRPASSSSAPQRAFTTNFVPFSADTIRVEDDSLDFADNDPDLPSHTEIEEMSKRLFDSATLAPPSNTHTWQRLHSPLAHDSTELPDGTFEEASDAQGRSGFLQLDEDGLAQGGPDDEDFEFGTFDLSKVLGALQGAKEEIAGMEDEGERRKAAARVALGLVYGLKQEEERERGVNENA